MTTLACIDLVELVTDYLEHSLDAGTVRDFDAHLELCPGCDVYLEQMRSTITQLGHIPLETPLPPKPSRRSRTPSTTYGADLRNQLRAATSHEVA